MSEKNGDSYYFTLRFNWLFAFSGRDFPTRFPLAFFLLLCFALKAKGFFLFTTILHWFFHKNRILLDSSQNIATFAHYQNEMSMSPTDYTHILTKAVDELSDNQSYRGLFHQHREGEPLPSGKSLERIVELARAILFPGLYGYWTFKSLTIN